MVTLQIKPKVTPSILSFLKKEWRTADLKYRGKVMNWKVTRQIITAYDDKKLVGALEFNYVAGVMHIEEIIVAFSHHKQGIGERLMKQAEEIAKKEKLHKIFLETGATWGVTTFYEKLGYVKTGEMPRHNGGQDYLQYSKFL